MSLDFKAIDAKWQNHWRASGVYQVKSDSAKPKYYILDMFPYPSGSGLHVGHPLGYIASDIIARYKRMQGYNVLHPMGWDAFGLPAEQYAIQTGQHPAETTRRNIARFREQLDQMGFCFDWSREVSTADPAYYHWTQWTVLQIFAHWYDQAAMKARPIAELVEHFAKHGTNQLQAACSKPLQFSASDWQAYSAKEQQEVLLNYRLAYLADAVVNWCPALGTVLANDEVAAGFSIRGNHPVEQKKMRQWALRVTAYAERLLRNLDSLDWPEAIIETQKHWIGRSHGAQLFFDVMGHKQQIEVFTTRPDTVFGASFIVLAPEHPLALSLTTKAELEAVEAYRTKARGLSERERLAEASRVSGVFTGSYAIHPFTGKNIPIWLSDYVIASYGTGAIMAVPAHDSRDHAFAKHFGLPIVTVVHHPLATADEAYEGKEGTLQNSDFLNGLNVESAIAKAISAIEARGRGRGVVQYRLRDAIFSRQRYWGEPMPIEYVDGLPQALPVAELPLTLPAVDKYLPTETGEPPLARAKNWTSARGNPLDLNTMPGFAGSSAYFLRYMDPHNKTALVAKEASRYWQDVDLYVGGREHATGHLIYARFWNMFLYDIGVAYKEEPFKKLVNQGMITGRSSYVYRKKGMNHFVSFNLKKDDEVMPMHVDVSLVRNDVLDLEAFKKWRPEFHDATFDLENGKYVCGWAIEKMSKSYFNVVNPDDVVAEYGADTLRLYEMFLGPLEQSKPWKSDSIEGVYRFLKRLYALIVDDAGQIRVQARPASDEELRITHVLVKKIKEDLDSLSFNTAVAAFMIALNGLSKLEGGLSKDGAELVLRCLAPFAPHLAEELWQKLGATTSIIDASFPNYEERYTVQDTIPLPISVNGKKRLVIDVPASASEEQVKAMVLGDARVSKHLEGQSVRKLIYVEKRMFNIVI